MIDIFYKKSPSNCKTREIVKLITDLYFFISVAKTLNTKFTKYLKIIFNFEHLKPYKTFIKERTNK